MLDCPVEDVLGAFASGDLEPRLSAEVEQHVADCSRCAAAIGVAAGAGESTLDEPIERGARLDRYHVLDVAGAGAVGLVYAAYDPKLDRKVALKVLRRAAPELEERLQREARALARVHSPHVVAVHDTGIAAGRLYVAMELVEGQTLREWLAARKRGVGEILEAFRQAGRGLAAAHAAGIVHRDFKPDNVLVRPGGQVAVTDFGLALAAADPDTHRAGAEGAGEISVDLNLTSTGTLIGTPAFMAPEQYGGARADARSDLFSFCVALYAALFGRHPYPISSMTELADAMQRGIVLPPRDGRVPRRVREAVMAGLRPRPEDRPASMTALLERLEVVPAARRVGLALAGIGIAGGVAALLLLRASPGAEPERRCRGAERRLAGVWDDGARAEVRRTLAATGSALAPEASHGVERALDDYAARWRAQRTEACEATRIRGEQSEAVLDKRNACLDERLLRLAALVSSIEHAGEAQVQNVVTAAFNLPAIERCADPRAWTEPAPPASPALGPLITLARATAAKAKTQAQLGDVAGGLGALAPALRVAERTGDRPLQAEVRLLEGQLRFSTDPKGAELSLQAAAIAAQSCGRADLAGKAWLNLARRLGSQQRIEEANRWADYAEAAIERSGDALLRADLLMARGVTYANASQPERAIPLYQEALATFQAQPGPTATYEAEPLGLMADALIGSARPAEALPLRIREVQVYERGVGRDHPYTLDARSELAFLYRLLGRHDEALAALTEVLAAKQRVFGTQHPSYATTLSHLALVNYDMGRTRESIAGYRRALAIREAVFGPTSPDLVEDLGMLAHALASVKELAEADDVAKRAVAIGESYPKDSQILPTALAERGEVLLRAGRCREAVPLLARSRDLYEAAGAGAKPQISDALDPLAHCLTALGKYADAEAVFLRSLAVREKAFGATHPFATESLDGLSVLYHKMGDDRRAAEAAERAVHILVATRQSGNNFADARLHWAEALWSLDRDGARRQAAQALADLAAFPDLPARHDVERWLATHP